MTPGNLTFHVIVNDAKKRFSMDGPEGPNGVRLHYEVIRVAREHGEKLRDFDLRAPSRDAALVELQSYLPGYSFSGAWSKDAV